MNSRDIILERIREAVKIKTPKPFPDEPADTNVFSPPQGELVSAFEKSFTRVGGTMLTAASPAEAVEVLKEFLRSKSFQKIYSRESDIDLLLEQAGICGHDDLADSDIAVTGCEFLVARTGSLLLSAASESGRTASVYAPVHLCVASASQIVPDIADALAKTAGRYGNDLPSFITLATGPSRTADIEKTLVTGVHGPGEVYCLLITG